jgi:hypothetical protein
MNFFCVKCSVATTMEKSNKFSENKFLLLYFSVHMRIFYNSSYVNEKIMIKKLKTSQREIVNKIESKCSDNIVPNVSTVRSIDTTV